MDGWMLHRGDSVTLSPDAGDVCYLQFGLFRSGVFSETGTLHENSPSFTYDVAADGLYRFSIEYYCAAADTFTNASLAVR